MPVKLDEHPTYRVSEIEKVTDGINLRNGKPQSKKVWPKGGKTTVERLWDENDDFNPEVSKEHKKYKA